MQTQQLIDSLVQDGGPVSVLPPPGARVARWLLVAPPVVLSALFLMGLRPDFGAVAPDPIWLIAQLLALATAVLAALGALVLTLPGLSTLPVGLALASMGLWMMALGAGCAVDAQNMGPGALSLVPEPECFVLIAAFGALPFVLLVTMVRRGAPLASAHAFCCSAIAAGAIGAFTLGLVHPQPLSLMVLVWQWGSVLVLGALGLLLGMLVERTSRRSGT
jgi:hypothetical protein